MCSFRGSYANRGSGTERASSDDVAPSALLLERQPPGEAEGEALAESLRPPDAARGGYAEALCKELLSYIISPERLS